MKKLIALALLASLSSNVSALNLDESIATEAYISSFSNGVLLFNLDAGETVNIYAIGPTKVFCAMATFSDSSKLLFAQRAINYVPINFTARTKDIHLVLCLKDSGISAKNYVLMERGVPAKRTKKEMIDSSNIELINQAKEQISKIIEEK